VFELLNTSTTGEERNFKYRFMCLMCMQKRKQAEKNNFLLKYDEISVDYKKS